jgi:hypothetical protein
VIQLSELIIPFASDGEREGPVASTRNFGPNYWCSHMHAGVWRAEVN